MILLLLISLSANTQKQPNKTTTKQITSAKPNKKPAKSQTTKRSPKTAKKLNLKPKVLPKPPSPENAQKMIQKGEIIDFGEPNILHLKTALDSAQNSKNGDLVIMILGDSHIAGDFIPQQWRKNLMEANSVGFAYPIAPSYHQNLLIHYKQQGFELYHSRIHSYPDYPMGGVVARAKNEQAKIQLSLNFPQEMQDFLVRIVFKAPNKLAAFLITDSQGKTKKLSTKTPDIWDISDAMQLHFPITIQALLPNASLGGYFIYNKKHNTSVSHMGTNGARSDMWMKWNEKILIQELGVINHDLIALSYGSNDAMLNPFNEVAYKENYANLIALLRTKNPNASILIVGPPKVLTKPKNAKTYKITPNYDAVRKATKQIAKENHTLYFDMDDFIQETGGKDKWITLALSKSDVHLTPYGYRLIADAMSSGLLRLVQPLQNKKSKHKSDKKTKENPNNIPDSDTNESASNEIVDSHSNTESIQATSQENTVSNTPNPVSEDSSTMTQTKEQSESTQDSTSKDFPKQKMPQEIKTKEAQKQETSTTTPQEQPKASQKNLKEQSPQNSPQEAQDSKETYPNIPIPPPSSAPQEVWQELEMKEF